MAMMHSSPSITSPASQEAHLFFCSPPPGSGFTSPKLAISRPPPHHTVVGGWSWWGGGRGVGHHLFSLRRSSNLKPCLSDGFRDTRMYIYIYLRRGGDESQPPSRKARRLRRKMSQSLSGKKTRVFDRCVFWRFVRFWCALE